MTTFQEMKDALLSHDGIAGERVVAVDKVDESNLVKDKIPGISMLHNYEFRDEKLLAWIAYDIGGGRVEMEQLEQGKKKGLNAHSYHDEF